MIELIAIGLLIAAAGALLLGLVDSLIAAEAALAAQVEDDD